MTEAHESKHVILAALDLEEGSPGVVSHALELAAARPGSELHVVAVVPLVETLPFTAAGDDLTARVEDVIGRLRAFVVAQLDDFRHRRPAEGAAVHRVQVHCSFGPPAAEVVWLAAHLDADLVVVGTHGRRGLKRLLVGSVAEKIARLAGCPVVVIRDKQHVAPWRVPEIEPLCPDCAEVRSRTEGRTLWCERHAVHHARAHVVSHSINPPGPSPVESATGI